MTRRELFRKAILTPIATVIGIKLISKSITYKWDKTRIDFVMHPAQEAFTNRIDNHLYGIPYHLNNGMVGAWQGFNRAGYISSNQKG